MSLKDVIIILLVICIVGTFLFGSIGGFFSYVSSLFGHVADGVDSNEGYVYEGGSISSDDGSSSSSSSVVDSSSSSSSVVDSSSETLGSSKSSESSGHNYKDWQRDYETDFKDSEGNPVYVSIVSTSGGQLEPGIYEVYWSSSGPINQTRIE